MTRCWRNPVSIFLLVAFLASPAAFAFTRKESGNPIRVTAVETFLADITQNVAGDRARVKALLPVGADPHTFQPTPADLRKVADTNILVVNGAGVEEFLDGLLKNTGGVRRVIDASAGLSFRTPREGEPDASDEKDKPSETAPKSGEDHKNDAARHEAGDPHFWLSPVNVVRYVENIRNGLSEADPGGAEVYAANARAYTAQLMELDRWIAEQVNQVPEGRRLLVTDHDEFGYFADRYGFRVVGMIVPSVSTEASPSARQVAQLVKKIRKSGVKAIFLEAGEPPQLAEQIARESGARIVTGLYTHSVSQPGGPASNYIDMMRYDTMTILNALRQ